MTPALYLYVAAGGVVGTLARLAIGVWLAGPPGSFPWATLLVNVSGSLLLGFLMHALPGWGASLEVRGLLTVGLCGSFTTFSTFGYETVALAQTGAHGLAAAYAVGSVLLGVTGVVLGLALAATIV